MYESKATGFLYVSPFVAGLLVFTAFPFVYSLYLSFTDYNLISAPKWSGLANYSFMLLKDRTFWQSLKVTFIYVFMAVPLKLAFALFIAYILNYKLKFINLFRTAYYVPSILGGSIAVAVLWRYIFAETGLVNLLLSTVGVEPVNFFGDPDWALFTIVLLRLWQFGSAMVIFLAALQAVPASLYEAASIDGASKWRMFRSITVPLISPVIFFNLIMQLVQAFQEFNGPYVITGGRPLKATYLMPLYIYETSFKQFDMGYGAALSWVLFLIIAIFTVAAFVTSKYWVYYAGDKKS